MARTLLKTTCERCGSTPVLDESPRYLGKDDCGIGLFDEYEGLKVADASCPTCGAKYIAWVDEAEIKKRRLIHPSFPTKCWPRGPKTGIGYFALSYRGTFSDEPGPDDYPEWGVLEERYVTRDGYTKLPDIMIKDLDVVNGGYVWFVRSKKSGRWEAWTEESLEEYFGGPSDD